MARVFKFFAAFFVTAVVIFGAILAFNWDAFNTFYDNRDAMVEGSQWVEETYSLRGLSNYIDQNPDHVSIVSSVIETPDSTIRFMEHVKRPMGTTANFFILVAAAEMIESGAASPDMPVSWSEVTDHLLPGVNRSEHEISYTAASERGWLNDNDELSLDNTLQLLAEFNALSLADKLWWHIGQDRWTALADTLSLNNTDMPLPYSGLYLTISPGIRDMEAENIYDLELVKEPIDYRDSVIDRADNFLNDPEFRENTLSYMEDNRLGNTFMQERDALALFPKTTASEMTDLLEKMVRDELISPGVSQRVKDWMRWPMERQSGIRRDFTDYGAIYDNRMGLLNGIDFGTSRYTGDTTVQAVFFDRIQIAFWFHMSSNHMHQDFQQRLIFDPAMIEQMKEVESSHRQASSPHITP
ncbi:hypothetical protein [Rhodohalobacter sp. 8-1]|uniref:hypothetical protein n=1 Tax=Rhodohalobacter sp. 8-1 TaxID=3131972 RepID=UPI0030EC77BE